MKKLVLLLVSLSLLATTISCREVTDVEAERYPQDGQYYDRDYVIDHTSIEILYHGDPDGEYLYYAQDYYGINGARISLRQGYFEYVEEDQYIYESDNLNVSGNFLLKVFGDRSY